MGVRAAVYHLISALLIFARSKIDLLLRTTKQDPKPSDLLIGKLFRYSLCSCFLICSVSSRLLGFFRT